MACSIAKKVTPLGPTAGAGLGVVTGVGAANSLGVEVTRCAAEAMVLEENLLNLWISFG